MVSKRLLSVFLLFGIALGCDPREYNVYVYNDFACSNSDVEGRLAAGGNIALNNYAVGCQIYNTNPSTNCIQFGSVHCADHPSDEPSLVAGGDLSATNVQVYAGSVVYGGALATTSFNTVLDCAVTKTASYGQFVRAAFPVLIQYSNGLAARTATETVTNNYGTLTFATTSNTAVWTISSTLLASANTLVLNAPATATELIINVSGASASMGNFGLLGSFTSLKHSILWNFADATSLTIANVGVFGSILAPNADLTTSNGVFNGQLLVKSVKAPAGQTCGQFNHAPFGSWTPPSGVCGNGVVDSGEQCDGGACCNVDCTFVASSTNTVCRASAGDCDVPEMCSGSSADCPVDAFKPATTPCGSNFGVCDVQLKTHCPGDAATCQTAPPAYIFYWDAFNVISMDSYTCHGGDVEGRLAVRNKMDVSGFTVGLETRSTDPISYYDVVVAQDATWVDGSVNRGTNDGQGVIAVGGTFNAPAYLQARRDENAYVPTSIFDEAKAYYTTISNTLSALATNAVASVVYGDGLLLTCTSASESLYHVKVDASVLSSTNWYLTSGCSFSAAWIIDVTGTTTLSLKGSPFSGVVERVVYNVQGGNDITANNGVAGNILAPNSDYFQTAGVTYGRVIVGNVTEARQNNKPNCIDFKTVVITNKILKKVNLGDDFVYVVDIGGYAVGDQVCINGNCRKILKGQVGDIDGDGTVDNVLIVDAAFATEAPVMFEALTVVDPNVERESIPVTRSDEPIHSGASVMAASIALAAVAALF